MEEFGQTIQIEFERPDSSLFQALEIYFRTLGTDPSKQALVSIDVDLDLPEGTQSFRNNGMLRDDFGRLFPQSRKVRLTMTSGLGMRWVRINNRVHLEVGPGDQDSVAFLNTVFMNNIDLLEQVLKVLS